MDLTSAEVAICNQALDQIGSANIELAVQTTNEALKCITHYVQTRDSLLRSYKWNFASTRKILSTADSCDPVFGYDYAFILPLDFKRLKNAFEISSDNWTIEGNKFLTDDSLVNLEYIRNVTNPEEFDPLFSEILVLQLAIKLVSPLTGTNTNAMQLKQDLKQDLMLVLGKSRTIDASENNNTGSSDWNDARYTNGIF